MLNLRAGEWVEVKSAPEILATLDRTSSVEGLPFMPEMLQYCGRRFRVFKTAHKTCDTIETFKLRRMPKAVHLEGLRCDGAAHGGCQAGCLLFWKEDWLKRSPAAVTDAPPAPDADCTGVFAAARQPGATGGPERYRCQATELRNATTATTRRDRFDPRFYIKDLTSGNVSLGAFVKFGLLAVVNSFLMRWWGRKHPHVCGLAGDRTPTASMDLAAGDLVQVRRKQEIMRTLNPGLRNRGLGFDVEMVQFCENGPYRVLRNVERIVNEKTGEMMTLPNRCLVLDGVVCSGHYSANRMFCPRSVFPYWREIWLERAGECQK